jgi:hypothetical protein
MSYRGSQINMAKAFTADLGWYDFNTALFADDTAVLHTLVLTAVTLVVLGRTKDLGAKQAVTFRLEGPVVNGLRLFNLAKRTLTNLLWRRDGDTNG